MGYREEINKLKKRVTNLENEEKSLAKLLAKNEELDQEKEEYMNKLERFLKESKLKN